MVLALLLLIQAPGSGSSPTVMGKGSPTAEIPRLESLGPDRRQAGRAGLVAGHPAHRLLAVPAGGWPARRGTDRSAGLVRAGRDLLRHHRPRQQSRARSAPPWPTATTSTTTTHVVLDLDTFHDRRRAFFFGVNPLGVQSDGVRSEGAGQVSSLIPGSTDKNPDFTWESKGRITDRGYEVEIRIPFKSLRYPGSRPAELGLQRHPRGTAHRLHRHLDRRAPGQRQLPGTGRRDRRAPRPAARGDGGGPAVRDRHRRRQLATA